MEIKEIDGKKFIDFDEYKQQRKRFVVSVIFLILIAASIISLIVVTKTLIDNKEIISKDPISYGMKEFGFISCQCFDKLGIEWYSTGEGFINQQQTGYGGEWVGAG